MRIAFTADKLLRCGGIRVPFEHINELQKRGHDVAFYCNGVLPEVDEWIKKYNATIKPLGALTIDNIDALISVWWPQMDELLQYPAKRRFHFNQGRDYLSYPDGSFRDRNLQEMQRKDYTFISVSEWAGKSCHKPHIVPNGVNEFWCPSAKLHEHDTFRILIEGSTSDPSKGRAEALEICRRVKNNKGKLIEVWEINRDNQPDDPIVDKKFTTLNDDEMKNAYHECDMLLKTSHFDGFGLPHLEAMACGLPVVTTDAGGNRTFCEHGMNCLMAPVKDVDTLTAHTLRMVDDRAYREYLATRGLQTAGEYTWERSTNKLLKAIV